MIVETHHWRSILNIMFMAIVFSEVGKPFDNQTDHRPPEKRRIKIHVMFLLIIYVTRELQKVSEFREKLQGRGTIPLKQKY